MNIKRLMGALPLAVVLGLAAPGCALADPPDFENGPIHYGVYLCSNVRAPGATMYMKFDGAYVFNYNNSNVNTYWVKPAPSGYPSSVYGRNVGRFRVIMNSNRDSLGLNIQWQNGSGIWDYDENYSCQKYEQYNESQLRGFGLSIW